MRLQADDQAAPSTKTSANGSQRRSLKLEILSSQSRVYVNVDGTMVWFIYRDINFGLFITCVIIITEIETQIFWIF